MAGGYRNGGSLGLAELIEAGHGKALRADLQRYYGLDVTDIWRGTLHPIRVWQLCEMLPSDSALMSAISGNLRDWNLQAQLTAGLINALRSADANNVKVNGGKMKTPKPIEVPKPKTSAKRFSLAGHPLARKLGGD